MRLGGSVYLAGTTFSRPRVVNVVLPEEHEADPPDVGRVHVVDEGDYLHGNIVGGGTGLLQ